VDSVTAANKLEVDTEAKVIAEALKAKDLTGIAILKTKTKMQEVWPGPGDSGASIEVV
jgi:hypothetical protein